LDAEYASPRVLIIDRRSLIVAALSRLLSDPPLSAVVLVTTRSNDALRVIEQVPIDVVVCDVTAEPISGPRLAAILAARCPPVKVILLADSESEPLLLSALRSGANGFFVKESAVEEFVSGVETVLHGQCAVGSALLGRVLPELVGRGTGGGRGLRGPLSPAEYSILARVGQAESICSIAETRGVSPKTIRNHLARIYHKLQVGNRAEAMLWAMRMGLTGLDDIERGRQTVAGRPGSVAALSLARGDVTSAANGRARKRDRRPRDWDSLPPSGIGDV
jgi:DNA-binding NarL/FixJ family response regulator